MVPTLSPSMSVTSVSRIGKHGDDQLLVLPADGPGILQNLVSASVKSMLLSNKMYVIEYGSYFHFHREFQKCTS